MLELSVVLVVIGLVVGGIVGMGGSMVDSAQRASTNNKLDAIEKALYAYRVANNRLPCPTDATLVEGGSNFGDEAANPGTCTGGSPAANFSATIAAHSNTVVVEGALPVKTLRLPDEFMFDGWGRKFGYAVWTKLTAGSGFSTYKMTNNCGAITVTNAGGGNRTTTGDYVLISYGMNGHGGYNKGGGRYSSGSTDGNELTNCHCNSSATDTGYAGTYVQKEMTSTFDDLVRFKERWQLANIDDTWSPSGGTACP